MNEKKFCDIISRDIAFLSSLELESDINAIDFSRFDADVKSAIDKPGQFSHFVSRLSLNMPEVKYIRKQFQNLDPFSGQYISAMRQLLNIAVSRDKRGEYSFACEGYTDEETEDWLLEHPYFDDNAAIGDTLIAYGEIIENIGGGDRKGSVLEPGCGMGSLSEILARSGFSVDALDVCPAFTRLTEKRILPYTEKTSSRAICSDLLDFVKSTGKHYDTVVFYESFHHLIDHQEILKILAEKNLGAGGRIILAGEPIYSSYETALPYDWGLRFDYGSIYQMRSRGWCEMGFKEEYLFKLFDKINMDLILHLSTGKPRSTIYVFEKH